MKGSARGFTLIELIIVIAVLSVLATVAMARFTAAFRKSGEGSCKGNLAAIRSAISAYAADHEGQYPPDLSALTLSAAYLSAIPAAKVVDYHANAAQVALAASADDSGGWVYDNVASDPLLGSVWVNCTHTDSTGSVWASY